jgi:long-chain fatty acid transport protein
MVTWGNFDLSRSMMPIGVGNQALTAGFTQAAGILGQMAGNPALTAEQAAQYQAMAQQAQAGATYFQNNLTNTPIVSAKLKGDSKIAIGVNTGALWSISDKWSLAMTYRSRMNMKVDKGHGTLTYGSIEAQQYLTFLNSFLKSAGQSSAIPALDQGTFNSELPLPTVVTWGVSFRPTPRWELAVDLQWTGWSAYKELNVAFNEKELGIKDIYSIKNYSNTLAFRFGGQYHALKWLTARMGMYVDESPVDSNYLNPETPSMTKVAYTAGLSIRPHRAVSIDLAYAFVSSADPERTGSYPLYDYNTGKLQSIFSGNYKLHANVISLGVGIRF